MPTATTTATDALRGVIEEGGTGPASNQHRRSGGPTDWVQFKWPPPASGARQPDTDGHLARGRHWPARRQRRGHDAALGRRSRVAHMPTATTATATDDLRSVIKEVGAGSVSNQERPSSGPADGVRLSNPEPIAFLVRFQWMLVVRNLMMWWLSGS